MQFQAATYGWKFVMEKSDHVHKPCIGWSTVSQLALMFVLAMLLAARAQAANWVTVKTGTGSGFGLNYTVEIQVDTDATTPTTQSTRISYNVTGSPTSGSGPAYAQFAFWTGRAGVGTYLGGFNTSTYPTIGATGASTLSNTQIRAVEVSIQNTGAPVGYSETYWEVKNDIRVKKVRVAYFNSKSFPVQIKVVDAANTATVIASTTVAARSGFIQTITLPDGVDSVTVLELVDDFAKDGPSWVVSEGTTTEVETGVEIPGELVQPTAEPSEETNVPQSDIPEPENPNTNSTPGVTIVTINPRAPSPWTPRDDLPAPDPASVSDFTVSAYREGVDKIVKSIEGETVNQPDNVEPPDNVLENLYTTSDVSTAAAKLPDAPSFTSLAASSTITISFEIPKLGGGSFPVSKTVDFAAEPYATPIAVFRALMTVLLTLVYFIMSFYAVRSAFAGK